MTIPKEGDLRVWHIPQVPMKPFFVAVSSIDEGKRICEVLADYDLFQYQNKIKPDYANAQGISVYREDLDCELGEPGWIDVEEDEEDE
jgi:hypothetical protein